MTSLVRTIFIFVHLTLSILHSRPHHVLLIPFPLKLNCLLNRLRRAPPMLFAIEEVCLNAPLRFDDPINDSP